MWSIHTSRSQPSGPLIMPVKVGYQFQPIRGLVGGQKSSETGVSWVDLVPNLAQNGR